MTTCVTYVFSCPTPPHSLNVSLTLNISSSPLLRQH